MSKSCECSLQNRRVFTPDFNYSLYNLCFLLQSNETVQYYLAIVCGRVVKVAWSRAPEHTTVHQMCMLIYLINLTTLWRGRVTSKVQVDSGTAVACSKVSASVCQRHYFLFQFTKSEKKIMPSSSADCTSQSSLNIKIHSQEFLLGVITVINVLQCQPLVYMSITVAFSPTAHSLHRCSLF